MSFLMLPYVTKRDFPSVAVAVAVIVQFAVAVCLSFGALNTAAAQTSAPRIVSLTPHATEMLFAAGAGNFIVATVTSSDYPAQAQSIPKLGDGLNTSVEQVLDWQPDWVVGWPSTLMTQLKSLGVKTMVLEAQSLDEIPVLIHAIGDRLGTVDQADVQSAQLFDHIKKLSRKVTPRLPVDVAVLASPDGQYVLGKHPLINQTLDLCGGQNVFADTLATAPAVSLESLLAANPKIVFSGHSPPAWLADQFEVMVIDPDWLYRPGPRFINAAEQICTKLKQVGQSSK
ncbi:MAG: ABC transporter substrate-binding protein [Orrella sp.]